MIDDEIGTGPEEEEELARTTLGTRIARLARTIGGWLRGMGTDVRRRAAERRVRRAVVGLAVVAALVVLATMSVVRVREGEVGVLVNNLTGSLTVEERVGYRITMPWVHRLYRLDRRVQSLVMSDTGGVGFRGGDAVKIKSSDGSNVSLDIEVSYRIRPGAAPDILRDAGPGLAVGALWARAAVRAAIAAEFGKLNTEQLYDASLRNERAQAVVAGLNETLAGRGIEVVAVVPQDLRFYKEYEEIIKQKKLADQEVEEKQAQARLATEEQNKRVAAAGFAARASKARAQGKAERLQAEADGYVRRVRTEAEGALYKTEKEAEGLRATGLADAEGLRRAAAALSGAGGVNLVAHEYAQQLGRIGFTGVPVVQDGHVTQFRHHNAAAGAAAAGGGR